MKNERPGSTLRPPYRDRGLASDFSEMAQAERVRGSSRLRRRSFFARATTTTRPSLFACARTHAGGRRRSSLSRDAVTAGCESAPGNGRGLVASGGDRRQPPRRPRSFLLLFARRLRERAGKPCAAQRSSRPTDRRVLSFRQVFPRGATDALQQARFDRHGRATTATTTKPTTRRKSGKTVVRDPFSRPIRWWCPVVGGGGGRC